MPIWTDHKIDKDKTNILGGYRQIMDNASSLYGIPIIPNTTVQSNKITYTLLGVLLMISVGVCILICACKVDYTINDISSISYTMQSSPTNSYSDSDTSLTNTIESESMNVNINIDGSTISSSS